jgi:hypothetical protein
LGFTLNVHVNAQHSARSRSSNRRLSITSCRQAVRSDRVVRHSADRAMDRTSGFKRLPQQRLRPLASNHSPFQICLAIDRQHATTAGRPRLYSFVRPSLHIGRPRRLAPSAAPFRSIVPAPTSPVDSAFYYWSARRAAVVPARSTISGSVRSQPVRVPVREHSVVASDLRKATHGWVAQRLA